MPFKVLVKESPKHTAEILLKSKKQFAKYIRLDVLTQDLIILIGKMDNAVLTDKELHNNFAELSKDSSEDEAFEVLYGFCSDRSTREQMTPLVLLNDDDESSDYWFDFINETLTDRYEIIQ